jgi:hypothetical protein
MRSRVRRLTLLLLAGACQPQGATPDSVSQAIVGGSLTTGDPQVPLVYLIEGEYVVGMCTGTLISPRVVLTAAHCVAADSGATAWAVYFGSTINSDTDPAFMALKDVTAHTVHPLYDAADIGAGNDFALLQIEDTGPVAPKPINRTPITDALMGQPVRLVGFGDSSSGAGGGVKRQAATTLSDYDSTLVIFGQTGGNTCQGDSGGPNFMTIGGSEVVVGVTSFGDPGCTDYGAGGRVDRFQGWIDPWVESHDTIGCGMDGGCASGCGAVDPDCPCANDGRCTTDCTVPGADPDCPVDCRPNGTCLMTGCPIPDPDCASCGADGSCKMGCPGRDPDCPVGVGEPCAEGPDCTSGQCLPDPQDAHVSFCTSACNDDGSGCPEGMACGDFGGQFFCIHDGVAPGAVGFPCATGDECASGRCETFGEQQMCTGACDEGYQCREGWVCDGVDAICVPWVEPPAEDEKSGCRSSVAGPRSKGGLGAALLAALVFLSRRARRRRPSRAGS